MIYIPYDIEIYPDRFMLGLKWKGKNIIYDKLEDIRKVPFLDKKYKFVGFNNRRYDQPILDKLNQGYNKDKLYKLSKSIISGEDAISWNDNIIDLLEICPKSNKCSLKEFGHRMGYKTLANLPYPYDKPLSEEEWEEVKKYNIHDLNITEMLWEKLKPEYDARQSLKVFFDIKTEFGGAPNLAAKCILSKLSEESVSEEFKLIKKNNLVLNDNTQNLYNKTFDFHLTDYLKGKKPELMEIVDEKNIKRATKYTINDVKIKIGIGGLHGDTIPGVYHNVYDYDVTSYYPSIILNCKLGSEKFRDIYEWIYNKRLEFKKEGSRYSNTLKLILNSFFGKTLDKYSKEQIYAPNIGLSICFLGQFYLIDLLEKCGDNNCLSANTDGIVCKNEIDYPIIKEWENRTGFKLNKTKYKTFIMRGCNSYYAETSEGLIKRKKDFLEPIWKNTVKFPIIQKTVIDNITKGKSIEQSIKNEKDIYNFTHFVKSIKNGKLLLNGESLDDPKIRYYVSTDGSVLERQTPKQRARIIADSKINLIMDLEWREDINYDWYIEQCYRLRKRLKINDPTQLEMEV